MAKIEKLYGVGFSAENIAEGDRISVGGSVFGDGNEHGVVADYKKLGMVFARADEIYAKVDFAQIAANLEKMEAPIPVETFARSLAIQRAIPQVFPVYGGQRGDDAESLRSRFLTDGEKTLSQSMTAGHGACVEFSMVGHRYLAQNGIANKYMNGQVLLNLEHEFGEPHAFLMLPAKKGAFVYDVMDPATAPKGPIPSFSPIDEKQLAVWASLSTRQQALMVTKDYIRHE